MHIPLNTTATDAVAVIQIAVRRGRPTILALRVDGHPVHVPFAAGVGVVFLAATGPFDSIQVDAPDSPAHVCTADVTAGVPFPIPGTAP